MSTALIAGAAHLFQSATRWPAVDRRRRPQVGRAGRYSESPNRKWRRISLKTLETDSEMAGPTPSLTRGIRMRFLSWRPGLAVAAGPETGRKNELRVCAARSRRTNSVGRTRDVGERMGLWRFHPGRSLSGVMIAGQKERPEEQAPRITVGSVTFCTVDGVIWGRDREIGCGGDRGSP